MEQQQQNDQHVAVEIPPSHFGGPSPPVSMGARNGRGAAVPITREQLQRLSSQVVAVESTSGARFVFTDSLSLSSSSTQQQGLRQDEGEEKEEERIVPQHLLSDGMKPAKPSNLCLQYLAGMKMYLFYAPRLFTLGLPSSSSCSSHARLVLESDVRGFVKSRLMCHASWIFFLVLEFLALRVLFFDVGSITSSGAVDDHGGASAAHHQEDKRTHAMQSSLGLLEHAFLAAVAFTNCLYFYMAFGRGRYPGYIHPNGAAWETRGAHKQEQIQKEEHERKDGIPILLQSSDDEQHPQKKFEWARTCKHCNIPQPLRTKHCHSCGRCVAFFDHHCFWIGTCVGAHNLHPFLLLLACMTFCISVGNLMLLSQHGNWGKTDTSVILILIFSLSMNGIVGFVLSSQLYMVSTGSTTYEFNKYYKIPYLRKSVLRANALAELGAPKDRITPFDKGLCRNWMNFLSLKDRNKVFFETEARSFLGR